MCGRLSTLRLNLTPGSRSFDSAFVMLLLPACSMTHYKNRLAGKINAGDSSSPGVDSRQHSDPTPRSSRGPDSATRTRSPSNAWPQAYPGPVPTAIASAFEFEFDARITINIIKNKNKIHMTMIMSNALTSCTARPTSSSVVVSLTFEY